MKPVKEIHSEVRGGRTLRHIITKRGARIDASYVNGRLRLSAPITTAEARQTRKALSHVVVIFADGETEEIGDDE